MNPKWLGFTLFVWLFGLFIGATYEGDWTQIEANVADEAGTTSAMEVLFSPSENVYQGTSGEVKWWNPQSGYWQTWLQVLVWDFPFCKDYDANGNGVIDAGEVGNNDIGKYAGYFLKAFGIVELSAFVFAFFQFLEGILPW
jgi:hypothetical protein